MGQATSAWRLVSRGCPQGSALGPLLWNIFQNDLVESNLSMWADDHQIYEIHENLQEMKEKLTANAEKASEWYRNNLLKGNFGKYNTMTMYCNHNHQDKDDIRLRIQGTEIDSVDSLRLLGVTTDKRMVFNKHINNICKKAGQRVGVIMRLKNLIPTNAKLQLFKSSILPNLTYCHLT